MTKKELSERFGLSENQITKNFKRCQEQVFKKYNVKLNKVGRGEKTEYILEDIPMTANIHQSIAFIQDAHKEVVMDQQLFTDLIDWNFMVFMGITLCPMVVFRGTLEDFLQYVGVKVNANNKKLLEQSLIELDKNNLIIYTVDRSDNRVFTASILAKVEQTLHIGIDMVQRCMKLQKENSMNSWVPLLKTWLGLQIIALDNKQEVFTMKQLEMITGVNKKMLTKCKKILEEDNLFQTSRAFAGKDLCIGQNINLNGLEHNYSDYS